MNLLQQRRHAWLRRLAFLCAALMLATTSLSAFIRLSQAGLGCSDWPQCYGNRLRDAQQGRATDLVDSGAVTAARRAHRLVAVLALLLVITLVVVCFGNPPWLQREGALALALLALVLGLAVLGRWTAGSRVPAVAIGNLLGGLLMLALSWRLAAARVVPGTPATRGLKVWARVGVVVLLAQLALGALVSASYAGLSCAGASDCVRQAIAAGWPWHTLDPWREPVFGATPLPLNPNGALAQVVHRAGAVVVVLVLAPLGVAMLRARRRREGAALLALLALQIGVGALMVTTALPLAPALLHNLVAALLLATAMRLV
jgi:cytochrome c oxidase assembly protein subunit 15